MKDNEQQVADQSPWQWVTLAGAFGFLLASDIVPLFVDTKDIIRTISSILFPIGYLMQYREDKKRLLHGLILFVVILILFWF